VWHAVSGGCCHPPLCLQGCLEEAGPLLCTLPTPCLAATPTSPPACLLCSFKGLFWKFARIGERLSPWVSIACIFMAFTVIFF